MAKKTKQQLKEEGYSEEEIVLYSGGRPVKWDEEKALEIGKGLLAWLKEKEENIFFEEYLLHKGLYKQIIHDLRKKYKVFSELIKEAEAWQEMKINKNASFKKLDSNYSKFFMSSRHNYREKSELDHNIGGKEDSPEIKVKFI